MYMLICSPLVQAKTININTNTDHTILSIHMYNIKYIYLRRLGAELYCQYTWFVSGYCVEQTWSLSHEYNCNIPCTVVLDRKMI